MSGKETSKVLVIDDDDMVLIIIRKLLEAEMFQVDVALSARDGLTRLPENRYDVILCDMWMPGMTGKEFYYQVRREFPEYQDRIILLTGDIASEVTWDFIEQRRLPYVLKPVSPPELRRKLEEVMGEQVGKGAQRRAAESRRHRRVGIKGNVQVRKKKWAVGGPEITNVGNASKDGIYFLTDRVYRAGMEVMVAFPYTGQNDVEQEGYVVRVDERADGRRGIAVALGEAAEAARAEMAGLPDEDRQRQRILSLAEMSPETTRSAPAAEPVRPGDIKPQLAQERQESRRLAQELTDLKDLYKSTSTERDRLAAEEVQYKQQIRQLVSDKETMAGEIENLKLQLEEWKTKLAEAVAEREQVLREAEGLAQAARASGGFQGGSAGSTQTASSPAKEAQAETARLREEIKDMQDRLKEFQAGGVGPLTILAAYCDMLQMNKSGDEDARKMLLDIGQQAKLLRAAFQKLTGKEK